MKKKVFLVMAMCFALGVSASALAGCGGSTALVYELNEDGASYTVRAEEANESAEAIEIPAEHEGKPVTALGEKAFWSWKSLKSVTVPDSVTSIGTLAFASCYALETIAFPAGLTELGESAF